MSDLNPNPHSIRHCVRLLTTDEKLPQTKSEGSDVRVDVGQLTEDKHSRFLSAPAQQLGFHTTDKRHCCQGSTCAQSTMRGQSKVAALKQMTDNKQDNLQISRSLNVGSISELWNPPGGLMKMFLAFYRTESFLHLSVAKKGAVSITG